MPQEIALVTANSRCALASLLATTVGVPVAAGIDALAGGHAGGAAWVLRVGTVVYLLAVIPGFRLPSGVDEPAAEVMHGPGSVDGAAAAAGGGRPADRTNQPGADPEPA